MAAGRRHLASEVRVGAGRSYPASEVMAAGRRHPTSEVRGMTLRSHPEPEAWAGCQEEQPEQQSLSRHRRAWRSYPMLKVRNGKEIPLIQGKEHRLCFAGAAMKRYPTPKVRKTQVGW